MSHHHRQFRRALYLLLLLGMTGFALATESVGLWVLGCGAIVLNAWLVKTDRFTPIPRVLSNLVTIGGLIWVVHESRFNASTEVIVIGDYLVLLHLVKLYEQRGNRDYAQLLILGLLLMVAGSINTASLMFGLLLIVYLFLSLYCCLLFHLKVESDNALAAGSLGAEARNAVSQQEQRLFGRSLRRLTILVAVVSLGFAIGVFLFFPRGRGEGFLGASMMHPTTALTGFSNEVSFQQLARITQSNEIVGYVQVWKDDRPVNGVDPLLLRGATLEHYERRNGHGDKWTWTHDDDYTDDKNPERERPAELAASPPNATLWRQRISLRPTGTNALFAMAGPISIATRRPTRILFDPLTGTLQTFNALMEPLDYEVVSTNSLDPPDDVQEEPREYVEADPKVLAMAQRAEVSGENAKGPLAAQRRMLPLRVDPLDEEIASNIERYLRTHYTYTLDLTDARRVEGQDPIVAFLYDLKRGHCEYFAGAMTQMCQSLGMQARMVVGFRCDEYSDIGSRYIVRQSHAHAWVEVRTTTGWRNFDPTSGTAADLASRSRDGWWQRFSHVVDFLEYTYADNVIAYDNDDRQSLIQRVGAKTQGLAAMGKGGLFSMPSWVQTARFWNLSTTFIGALIWLIVAAMLGLVGMYLAEKWRLRRRAARIGLGALPTAQQQHLARQLGFYDALLRMLARHRIVRSPHLTPQEFSQSLAFLPADLYRTIWRLTQLFYRVRYGNGELDAGQLRRLQVVLSTLSSGLEEASSKIGARR